MSVYSELGVRPVLNAWGTVTRVGGSRMDPRVLHAMEEASRSFVDMGELHEAASAKIAELLGAEAACVTCGAAAGLAIATAACMAGADEPRILQLPDPTGLRDEVVVLKSHRILYDQAVLLAGARFVEVGVTSSATIGQLLAAIGERTAMVLYVAEAAPLRGSIPLRDIAAALRGTGVPVVVDAAAELPPMANLRAFLDDGADLVVFSGGKELRGPQSSGIILGTSALIAACAANAFPNYGIGRAMKTDKETIAGLVRAVELFVARDEDADLRRWERMTMQLVDGIAAHPACEVRRGFPVEPGVQPVGIPRAFVRSQRVPAAELLDRLRAGDPAVIASVSGDELVLNPQCLDDDEVQPVIDAVLSALR
jgi:L-seryl-tRNA(Ser) seleniumtransferase